MKLNFTPLAQSTELVSPSIAKLCNTLPEHTQIQVAEINPEYADGMLLHQHYDVPLEMELNCIIVAGTRSDTTHYAALVLPYGKRANTGSTVKQILDAKKVSFANLDEVIAATQMEFGSITPIGLPDNWLILLDESILQQENIIIGGGRVQAKIMMPSALLAQLPNVHIVQNLAKE